MLILKYIFIVPTDLFDGFKNFKNKFISMKEHEKL